MEKQQLCSGTSRGGTHFHLVGIVSCPTTFDMFLGGPAPFQFHLWCESNGGETAVMLWNKAPVDPFPPFGTVSRPTGFKMFLAGPAPFHTYIKCIFVSVPKVNSQLNNPCTVQYRGWYIWNGFRVYGQIHVPHTLYGPTSECPSAIPRTLSHSSS